MKLDRRAFLDRIGKGAAAAAGLGAAGLVGATGTVQAAETAPLGKFRRRSACHKVRRDAALFEFRQRLPEHPTNGDEVAYASLIGSFSKGLPHNALGEVDPAADGCRPGGFGTFGGPHILTLVAEVATRALKTVWFQKWYVHRRLRPEAFGGLIHNRLVGATDYPVHPAVLNSVAVSEVFSKYGTYPIRRTERQLRNLRHHGGGFAPILTIFRDLRRTGAGECHSRPGCGPVRTQARRLCHPLGSREIVRIGVDSDADTQLFSSVVADGLKTITARGKISIGSERKRFIRLRIVLAPAPWQDPACSNPANPSFSRATASLGDQWVPRQTAGRCRAPAKEKPRIFSGTFP